MEISQRDQYSIKAVTALAFYEIAREGHSDNAITRLRELESVIEKREGKSAKLLFDAAQLFLRVCGRNQRVIEMLRNVVDKCRKL